MFVCLYLTDGNSVVLPVPDSPQDLHGVRQVKTIGQEHSTLDLKENILYGTVIAV